MCQAKREELIEVAKYFANELNAMQQKYVEACTRISLDLLTLGSRVLKKARLR